MKRLTNILLSLALCGLTACTDDTQLTDLLPQVASSDEMEVNIGIAIAGAEADTRSFVAGSETANFTADDPNTTANESTDVKMLCFDLNGLFLTMKQGTITETGKLKGTVPNNTARIHFLFNFPDFTLPLGVSSMRESTLMRHESMTVDYTHDIVYWGYHCEDNVTDLKTWLEAGTNTVYLLRDRAMLKLNVADTDITDFQWTISNGLKRGLVAPRESNVDMLNPFSNNYYNPTSGKVTMVTTQFLEGGFYTVSDEPNWSDAADIVAKGWGGSNEAQYLFGNRNVRYPVKIIVRATYSDGDVRYHVLKLIDDNFVPMHVTRNEEYVLKVNVLSKNLGYTNLTDALNSGKFSNDLFASVGKEVTSVNNGTRFLTISSPVVLYTAGSTAGDERIEFFYTDQNGNGVADAVFHALWMDKDNDTRPDVTTDVHTLPAVTYNAAEGKGTITFSRATVENKWKFNDLRLICTKSGLYRDIDVYSYAYTFAPTLTRSGNDFKLKFSLPAGLPEYLFPISLHMASTTLQPVNIDYDTSKVARVYVASTAVSPIEDGNSGTWNARARSWNFWFEFPIDYKSSWTSGNYEVTLEDVRDSYAPANRPTNVGLYVELKSETANYGALRALTAQ